MFKLLKNQHLRVPFTGLTANRTVLVRLFPDPQSQPRLLPDSIKSHDHVSSRVPGLARRELAGTTKFSSFRYLSAFFHHPIFMLFLSLYESSTQNSR
jgi:hypothetical protein